MTWFPANNHPLDKSSYDFTITVPEDRAAVANGVLLGRRTTHGRTTFHWRQAEPMAAYLATATVGKFQVKQYTTRDGLKVYDAVDPREAAAAAPVVERCPPYWSGRAHCSGPTRSAPPVPSSTTPRTSATPWRPSRGPSTTGLPT